MQKGCIGHEKFKIKFRNPNIIKVSEDIIFLNKLFFSFDYIVYHQNQGVFKLGFRIII